MHASEGREFLRLLERARPSWLLAALGLQAATYLAEGQIWRDALRSAGHRLALPAAYRLALAKLFVDQAVPSAGISGGVLVASTLESRSVPREAVMGALAIDTVAYYAAYVTGLGTALAISSRAGHASAILIAIAALFAGFAVALAVSVLALAGRRAAIPPRLRRIAPIRIALERLGEADPRIARNPGLLLRATACSSRSSPRRRDDVGAAASAWRRDAVRRASSPAS